jgi:hypothetical protein
MRTTARQTRANRPITVDFRNETAYWQLLDDRKAFLACVLAFACPWACSCNTRPPGVAAGAAPATRMTSGAGWVGSLCGVFSARRAAPCARSCRPSSSALARCVRRWPAMRCGRPMASASGTDFSTRRQAGLRCSQTNGMVGRYDGRICSSCVEEVVSIPKVLNDT